MMTEREPTIFVVENDSAVRDSMAVLLESAGLRVELYASGEAFLAARTTPRRGCVLLDLNMPGLSGLEVMEAMAAKRIDLPVIIITAHGDAAARAQARQAGAVAFLDKPLRERALLDHIHQALGRLPEPPETS